MSNLVAQFEFSESLQETVNSLASFVPKLIGALVIFLIGRFIAKFIFKLLKKAFAKANVDSLVDKSGLGGPLQRAGFADAGHFLAKLVYWLLMFVIIKMTFDALDIDALSTLIDDLVNWIPKLIVAIIIVFITGAVANFVKDLIGPAVASESWGNAATTAAGLGIWFIGGTAALDQAEIAAGVVDTLFSTVLWALGAILVIKYGIGGIWAARDRFWPNVYNKFGAATADTSNQA